MLVPAAWGQTARVDFAAATAQVRQVLATQCEQYRELASTLTQPFEKEQARAGVAVLCDCFPGEFDRTSANAAATVGAVQARAETAAKGALDTCGARQFRARVVAACKTDVERLFADSATRQKYCGCLQTGVAKLTDEEIAHAAVAANRAYEARVQARAAGKPAPPEAETTLAPIEARCKADAR